MTITVNRPISAWYEESDSQPWWRIDYPPVAAYLSYIFGTIYRRIEPAAMDIQRGYES
jgi:alpha-1,3-glucosyltransferase